MAVKENITRVSLAQGQVRETRPQVRRVPAYIPNYQEASSNIVHESVIPKPTRQSGALPTSGRHYQRRGLNGMQVRRLPKAAGKPRSWQAKLGLQAAICVGILAIVWSLQAIDTQVTQTMVQGVQDAVTFEVDIDESIGRLKLVQEFLPNVSAVFLSTTTLVAPVQSPVQTYTKDGVYQAADFAAQAGEVVTAAGAGEIVETGVSEAGIGYIRVRHADGSEGRYENLSDITVQSGDKVARGTQLGVVSGNGKVMRFTWLVNGEAADPGFVE